MLLSCGDDSGSSDPDPDADPDPTVTNVSVTNVAFTSGEINLGVGDIYQLTVEVTPSDASNKTVNYASSVTSTATVTTAGVVTAEAVGTTTISVSSEDVPSITDSITVNVIPPFVVSELARVATEYDGLAVDQHRTHHVSFSIETGSVVAGEYILALRGQSAGVPTANEITGSSAVTHIDLGDTAINVAMTYHMDGTFFNLIMSNFANNIAALAPIVSNTLLQPSSNYVLYAMPSAGGTVETLANFDTDAVATLTGAQGYGMPTGYTFTVKSGKNLLLPYRFSLDTGGMTWLYNGNIITECFSTGSYCDSYSANYQNHDFYFFVIGNTAYSFFNLQNSYTHHAIVGRTGRISMPLIAQ